jgi:hypothetical protein
VSVIPSAWYTFDEDVSMYHFVQQRVLQILWRPQFENRLAQFDDAVPTRIVLARTRATASTKQHNEANCGIRWTWLAC